MFKIIGIKFNEGKSDLAIFPTEDLAKQAIKTIFSKWGFDKLLVVSVPKTSTDTVVIPADIAEDTRTYVSTKFSMNVIDWETLQTTVKRGTLTEFMLPTSGEITTKRQIDRIISLGVEEYDEDGLPKVVSSKLVHLEDTVVPYTKIFNSLRKEMEKAFMQGSYNDLAEDVLDVLEETSSSESEDVEEKERLEKEAKELAEKEAKAKALEQERLEKEAKAKELAEKERLEKETEAKKSAEQEAEAKAKALSEKEAKAKAIEKERLEKEAKAKALEKERLEKEAKAKELAEKEAEAKKLAEKERLEKEAEAKALAEKERLEKEAEVKKAEKPKKDTFQFDIDFDLDL